jgi:hypothetical protein
MDYQNESKLFRWILIFLSVTFFVIGVLNILNLAKILRDDDDNNMGTSRVGVHIFYWLNILLVCVCGYIFLYSCLKLLFGSTISAKELKKIIPSMFKEKAEKIFIKALAEGTNSIEATEAATAASVIEARKQGKNLKESVKIGIAAGTQTAIKAGYPKDDAKYIAKFAAENVIKNEIMKYNKFVKK